MMGEDIKNKINDLLNDDYLLTIDHYEHMYRYLTEELIKIMLDKKLEKMNLTNIIPRNFLNEK